MIPEADYYTTKLEQVQNLADNYQRLANDHRRLASERAEEIDDLRRQLVECQKQNRLLWAERDSWKETAEINYNFSEGFERQLAECQQERDRLRGKEGEKCQSCGRHYLLVWETDDSLWQKIVGHPGGLLCPDCFDKECREQGFFFNWQALGRESEGC